MNCHFSAKSTGHLGILTTSDRLGDAVDICAELSRVLETVHLSSLLITPTVMKAAAMQDEELG